MITEINFSTTTAQETYDRLKRCLDLSEDLLQKLNGHASSNKKEPQDIVKSGGQSEAEIINEGDVAPETVEPEIQDSSDESNESVTQKGTDEKENTSAKSTDEKSENVDPESFEKNKSDTETELETLEQNPSEKNEDSSDDVKINFTEKIEVQSVDLTSVDSTEQSISDESTAGQDLDNELNSDVDEAAQDIVERAIQDALGEETPTEEPTKADLKNNETDESEFVVQKDHTGEKIDFETIENIVNKNEEDIKENIENGENGNQEIDLKYYFVRLTEPKSAKRSLSFKYQKL